MGGLTLQMYLYNLGLFIKITAVLSPEEITICQEIKNQEEQTIYKYIYFVTMLTVVFLPQVLG